MTDNRQVKMRFYFQGGQILEATTSKEDRKIIEGKWIASHSAVPSEEKLPPLHNILNISVSGTDYLLDLKEVQMINVIG